MIWMKWKRSITCYTEKQCKKKKRKNPFAVSYNPSNLLLGSITNVLIPYCCHLKGWKSVSRHFRGISQAMKDSGNLQLWKILAQDIFHIDNKFTSRTTGQEYKKKSKAAVRATSIFLYMVHSIKSVAEIRWRKDIVWALSEIKINRPSNRQNNQCALV